MSEAADEILALEHIAERAAGRERSWIEASNAAVARHRELMENGGLGQRMALGRREPRHLQPPADATAAQARPFDLWCPSGLNALQDAVGGLARARRVRSVLVVEDEARSQRNADTTRTNAPSPQRRAAIDTELEIYATTVKAGRDAASEAWRVVPIVEHMARRGQLTEEDCRAAERFYRDFILGNRVSGLVSRYGERAGTGGTPISQREGGEIAAPEELRSHFHSRFIDACSAVNHQPTVLWMVRIICEQLMAAETRVPTLADAGRQYMGYKDAKQAQAVGATLLKTGLERLSKFYGL